MPKFQFFLPKKLESAQQRAVDEKRAIFLSGVPGTGKTVVSVYRLMNAKALGKKAIIFTYGKLLRKTIEEKLNNDPQMPVENIHHFMWKAQSDRGKKYLKVLTQDENISSTVDMLKSKGLVFDEILVDEGQDLSLNTYKILKKITDTLSISADDAQQINNKEEAAMENEILELFPKLRRFELDVIFRSSYEIYTFAVQFVPNNTRANNPTLLERLKIKNSGADKPYVYIEQNLNGMFETVKDIIDNNPTDNIGILFEKILHVDTFEKKLEKEYEVSKYHHQSVVPNELKNIIITTFKSAKGVEFDIVIIPYFSYGAKNIEQEYYVGATRAKNQLHFLSIRELPTIMQKFKKDSYELIDNR